MAAALLGVGALLGDAAGAEETYKKTSLYENGITISFIAFSEDGERIAYLGKKKPKKGKPKKGKSTKGKQKGSGAVKQPVEAAASPKEPPKLKKK